MEAKACTWTERTVESTFPFAVLRSEQWNPSDIAIGCWGVLWKLVPSADTVASRQGSPSVPLRKLGVGPSTGIHEDVR